MKASTPSDTQPQPSFLRARLAWLPIPLLILIIAVLWVENSRTVYESQTLLMISNFAFSTVASLLVVVLISRSFLSRGTPDLLMFGCGVLLWGAAGTVGPALLSRGGNVTISIHNILACLSAFSQLTGTLLALKSRRPFRAKRLALALSYAGVLGVVLLVALLVVYGWTPLFFVQGEGGTLLRQIVLVSTIMMFAGAAAILRESDRQAPKVFAKWYILSLLLIATGLFGVLLQSSHGSALNWTARVAQFLGGAYMLVAAYASLSDPRRYVNAPLIGEELPEVEFLAKLSQQTPLGIVLRYALSVVVVAAAMGLRLMLEAWGGYGLPTYITFYPAVMSVALLVGFGPGMLATVVAALAAMCWLMPPIGQFAVASTIDRLGVVFFSGMGLFMCLIAELYRRNRDKVAAYDREAALRESEKRLALAASATKIGIFEWNITSGRVFWTHTNETIFGYAPATVATATAEHDYHKLIDRIHPDDRQFFENELCRCMLEGTTLETEYRIIWPDGSLHWVETKGDLQHDSDGTATRMLGVVMDITERKQAEEALREANEFLRLFIEHAPAALSMFDTNMRYLSASRRWRYDYGLGDEELGGKSHYGIFPEITEDWKEAHRRGLSGEVLRAGGDRFERHDGSVQWVRWEIHPWRKSTGEIGGIVIFAEDITEIKQTEEILRRYELLARHSRDIILFIRSDDGRLLEVNAAAINCYGYDHEELLEMKIHELRGPEFTELTAEQMAEADTRGILFETVHRRKDGSTFPVEVSSQGATINGTRTLISVVRDITERKRAEEALRENRERLELALASSKMATFDWDILKGKRTWSDEVHSLLGTIPETFTGSAEEFFQIIHPEDRSTVQAALAMAVESTGLYMTEYRAVLPDGSIHHISARGKVQYDTSGRAVLMTGICWDITEHKQAEQELQKANDELEARVTKRTRELATALQTLQVESAERIQAVEALREREQMLIQQSRQAAMGEMIGNIAHQWRQPLNILALQTQQLLMLYDFGKFTRESLNSNVCSSMELIQHMSGTIDDFRNYFRPDKGKTEFALIGVITNTLSLIEDSFRNEQISIEIRAHDDPVITGFRNEFAQVILNILNNARDVLIEREVSDPRVTISLFAEGDRAVVSIADNAGGVPEEIMGKIFDPYFTTKGPQTGTGVGLFMSKSIIEKNMGGMLTVRNTADGAEFRIEVRYDN